MAATFYAVEPGRSKQPQTHKGVLLQGLYYATWPECEPERILTIGAQALFSSLADVPREIVADINGAIDRARMSPFRGFMSGDVLARYLKVTRNEVDTLGLRHVNAVDFTSADRLARRKASSCQRSEKWRRERGSVPKDEYEANSVTRLAPWERLGISRASFYRKPKHERDELIEKLRHTQAG